MVKVFWLAFSIFILDRFTKAAATGMEPYRFLPFLNFVYVENTGAAFGSFGGATAILILITLGVLYAMHKYKDYLIETSSWATGLILGGALGNLFDRVVLGYVVDFIDIFVGHYHWPAFNVADSALVIGVIILYMKGRESIESKP